MEAHTGKQSGGPLQEGCQHGRGTQHHRFQGVRPHQLSCFHGVKDRRQLGGHQEHVGCRLMPGRGSQLGREPQRIDRSGQPVRRHGPVGTGDQRRQAHHQLLRMDAVTGRESAARTQLAKAGRQGPAAVHHSLGIPGGAGREDDDRFLPRRGLHRRQPAGTGGRHRRRRCRGHRRRRERRRRTQRRRRTYLRGRAVRRDSERMLVDFSGTPGSHGPEW